MRLPRQAPLVVAYIAAAVLLAPASPATANPLKELDQLVAAYEVALTGDPVEDEQRIVAAMDQLEQIVEMAEGLDEKHLSRGLLRALEAYLILAEALLAAPCPETLGPDACALYGSMLAEKAADVARAAMATATSLHSSGEVKGADRRRFEELTERGSNLVAEAVMSIIDAPATPAGEPGAIGERLMPAPATEPVAGWTPPPTRATATDRFALVWGNAALYRTPDDPLPLHAYIYGDEKRPQQPDAVYVVQVIGDVDTDDLVEVRLGGEMEWDRHCVGSNLMPSWAAIRVHVEPDDFVPVLAEEVGVEHDDGTGVQLMPGTPRVGDRAWLDGQLVPFPPDATWATTYNGDVARMEDGSVSGYYPWDIAGTIGGDPFSVRQPGNQYGDEFYVHGWASDDDGGLITHRHRCGEVRFRVDGEVAPGDMAGIFGLLGSAAEGEWLRIPAGTRMHWVDGTVAGVTSRDHSVEAEQVWGEAMRCIEAPTVNALRGMSATYVPLCARPEDWVSD